MDEPASESSTRLLSGRYEVLKTLGTGGMALVYLARDLNLQRDVAIKVLRDDFTQDPAFRVRFLQEARAAANLIHPNIVTIYDFGHDEGRYYIVMEYVQGTDLKTLLRRRGPLSVREAADLMIQICAGVGYAHRAGLVHCDLKPQNILVTPDLRAKITDFGIARALATTEPDETSEVVWGSPQYFAPEQARGDAPTPASDVYALGVIPFEMITGRLPFEAADPTLLAELHQVAPPPSPRLINPDVPTAIEQIVLKVLSKEPSARYRTAGQLGRVLRTFASEAVQEALPPEPSPAPADPPAAYTPDSTTLALEPAAEDLGVDWLAVALGLLAFIAVGGLIPLWLWACLLYPSCPLNLF